MWPKQANRRNLRRIWFMQDGATPHTTNLVISRLEEKSHDRVISIKRSMHWPAQSLDLNPLDYWFWGHGKACVHAVNPSNLQDLMDSVEIFSLLLEESDIKAAVANIWKRLRKCQELAGFHFQQF